MPDWQPTVHAQLGEYLFRVVAESARHDQPLGCYDADVQQMVDWLRQGCRYVASTAGREVWQTGLD